MIPRQRIKAGEVTSNHEILTSAGFVMGCDYMHPEAETEPLDGLWANFQEQIS